MYNEQFVLLCALNEYIDFIEKEHEKQLSFLPKANKNGLFFYSTAIIEAMSFYEPKMQIVFNGGW